MLDKEIVDGFREEANQLMAELTAVIEQLETPSVDFPSALMAEFAQKIDRIMGAAKTISLMDPDHMGLVRIGSLAEICKRLGYQAAETKNPKLVPIFAAFWADVIETIQGMLDTLGDATACAGIAKSFGGVLQKRLEWLAKQVSKDQAIDLGDLIKTLGS